MSMIHIVLKTPACQSQQPQYRQRRQRILTFTAAAFKVTQPPVTVAELRYRHDIPKPERESFTMEQKKFKISEEHDITIFGDS